MKEQQKQQKLSVLNDVFTPSAPIKSRDLFFGRLDQLNQVVEAIQERGQHLVLFGERGVGKTSLANIVNEHLQGVITAKITCGRTESFRDIWTRLLNGISFTDEGSAVGFTVARQTTRQLDFFLPGGEQTIDASNIISALGKVSNPVLLIFDEFDGIKDRETKTRFADTIKALSDNAQHVTTMVVGIADNVNELVGDHPSTERCLKQVRVPRMSASEIEKIITHGLDKLELKVEPYVRLDMIMFASGFPHFAHLLGKFAAKAAIERGIDEIDRRAFDTAVSLAIENAQESIRESYQKAVITTRRSSTMRHVVAACALAKEDEHGTFRASDIGEPLMKVAKKRFGLSEYSYSLGRLCHESRGAILTKVGGKRQHRYRFRNPLVKSFIRLKLYKEGLVSGLRHE